jgi:hypothetical protein
MFFGGIVTGREGCVKPVSHAEKLWNVNFFCGIPGYAIPQVVENPAENPRFSQLLHCFSELPPFSAC